MISSRLREIAKITEYELVHDVDLKVLRKTRVLTKEDQDFLRKYDFYFTLDEYKNLYAESDEYDEDDDIKYYIPVEYDVEYLLNNARDFFFNYWNKPNIKNNTFKEYSQMNENEKQNLLKKLQKPTIKFYGYNYNESLVLFCDSEDKTLFGTIYNKSIKTFPVIELLIRSLYDLFSTNEYQGCNCENCVQNTMGSLGIKHKVEFTLRRFIDETKYILWESV